MIKYHSGQRLVIAKGVEIGKIFQMYEREGEGTDVFWTHSLADHSMRKISKSIWKYQKDCIDDLIAIDGEIPRPIIAVQTDFVRFGEIKINRSHQLATDPDEVAYLKWCEQRMLGGY